MRRDAFQAIADPTRREILALLATQRMKVNSIAERFEISRPAVSQQVKILEECGLVVIYSEGRERYCEANLAPLKEVGQWIERYRQLWQERHNALDDLLTTLMASQAEENQQDPPINRKANRSSRTTKRSKHQ